MILISWSNSLKGSALGFRAGIENLLPAAWVSLWESTADLSGLIFFFSLKHLRMFPRYLEYNHTLVGIKSYVSSALNNSNRYMQKR